MSQFINFEAEASDSDLSENEDDTDMDSFINDETESEFESEAEGENFEFANVTRSIEEVNREIRQNAIERIQNCNDYSNLSNADNEEDMPFEFDNDTHHIEKFKKTLIPSREHEYVRDFLMIIYMKIRHLLTEETDLCTFEDLLEIPKINEIHSKLQGKKVNFSLDLQEFNNNCYNINDALAEFGYFLRVYEQKNKYRQLLIKKPEKQNQTKQLAACIIQKFNGFHIIKSVFNKRQRRTFEPVDVIYFPTKNAEVLPDCYFTTNIASAFTALYDNGKKKDARAMLVYECYYCNKFFKSKPKRENHLKICSGKPGVVYNFCSRTITSFEENYKLKGDVPFAIYFDFETTAPTDSAFLDPEQMEMFVVSYVMVVAFHPFYNFDRILIQRSIHYDKKELSGIRYLTREQLQFAPSELIKQLYDQGSLVSRKEQKNALSVMFNIELAFVKKTLLAWFNKKVSAPHKRLDEKIVQKYEREFSYENSKCSVCKIPLRGNFTSPETPNNKMCYGDFIIRYEYKFLKNIFSQDELETSAQLKSLAAYYEAFEEYIHFCVEVLRVVTGYNIRFRDLSTEVAQFLEDNFNDCDMSFIKEQILETEIKNIEKTSKKSVPKVYLKVYAYLYDELISFPKSGEIDAITSDKLFIHVHNQIKQKLHLHHSHVTGEIKGFAHDFCNTKVVELESAEIPVIAHNLFRFDYWFFLKGYSTTAWTTKELSAGGNNLTNLNFSSIRGEIKFIDTIKYYQRSLAELTASMDEIEITRAKKTMRQYIEKHQYFSEIWLFLPPLVQEKILQITCEGKGIIPYEMVKDMYSFYIAPENDFWDKTSFYSELKQKHATEEEYNDSKYLFQILKMRNLGDLNDLYNAQDVILLSEAVENRFQFMLDKYGLNPRKCNSASGLSGCIEREMSKVIISFPTNMEHYEIFEKTVTGGFSCVNTRLAFDTSILTKKNPDQKVIYNINGENKRVISKIIKLDENNQYGHAMTKPLPTGTIKDNSDISFATLNRLLETVSLSDVIGHLFVVDIQFDHENATLQQIYYNDIFPPIIEKQTTVDPKERGIYQLLDNFREGKNGPLSYRSTAKAHSTMFPKKFMPIYLEDLAFIIKRYGWVVKKIHKHITFDQEPFKKDFILMNQKSRQISKTNAEKDFYKLMNNSNFGADCRNNADNIDFVPIFDEFNDVFELQKYYNLCNPKIENFVSGKTIENSVENKYNEKFLKLDKNDPFYEVKLSSIKSERKQGLESAQKLQEKKKRTKRKTTMTNYFDRIETANRKTNVKSVIDFGAEQSNSVKAMISKQNCNIKATTRFLSGKMLMFAKVSIKSFVCDMIDAFMFPDEIVKAVYEKYNIETCYLYQCLTDTDSTSLNVVFLCGENCTISESYSRKIVFEVMTKSKILKRLDLSHDFWADFDVQDKKLKKQVGLFDVENIEVANIITIAINPKEYREEFENRSNNKKHKGIKKGTAGMDFGSYCSKLCDIVEYFETFYKQKKAKKITQKRFQVVNDTMRMKTVEKIQFGQLNDKRFYFPNGIISLPYGHFQMEEIRKYRAKEKAIHKSVKNKKMEFIKQENSIINKNKRLSVFYQIINRKPAIYTISDSKLEKNLECSTKEYIEKQYWK